MNTGLVPDWCQANGQPASGFQYYYYYDATRTPWRIALDYIWFGELRARAFCEKITTFARSVGAANIHEGYYLDGSPIGWAHINVFIGPFAAGSMGTSSAVQAFCDSAYNENVLTVPSSVNGNYSNWSLRTLTLFVQTGNFLNPLDSTVHTPPSPPVLLSPAHASTGIGPTITLRWHSSATAARYGLQVALDSSFTALVVNDTLVADTLRRVENLSPLTSYFWRVNAKNAVGSSAYSPPWRFTTFGVPTQSVLLSQPNNALGLPTMVACVWRRATDRHTLFELGDGKRYEAGLASVDRYWFELTTDSNATPLVVDSTLIDTTRSVGALDNAMRYFWRVCARNEFGWGAVSPWWQFRTAVAQPQAPLLVAPVNGSRGNPTEIPMRWHLLAGAARY